MAKTKSKISVKRIEGTQAKIGFTIAFPSDDPKADTIYRAFAQLLKEILTPAEAKEFMRQFEREKNKALAAKE